MADPVNSVSVEAGALVVSGALTKFVAAEGDLLVINGVAAVISSRTSSTALRLKSGWPGATVQGSTAWEIVPTSPYWQSNVATSRKLSDLLARLDAGPIRWDAAGPFTDRSKYNGQPKDFVFLSYDPQPFTLYVKKNNDNSAASWSAGQAIQGVAAESTEQARTAADEAAASSRLATDKAAVATTAAATSTTQAGIATTGANTATAKAGIATDKAGIATDKATAAQAAADVATSAQPGMVFDYPTLQAARDATIPDSKLFIRTAGLIAAGDGYGAVYPQSAASTVAPGGFQSKNGVRFDVDPSTLRLELYGAATGNVAASLAAIQAVYRVTAMARLDTALTGLASVTDFNSFMSLFVQGRGKIDLPYKYVLDDLYLSALTHLAGDFSPNEHCYNSCRAREARELIMTDSIGTYQANTWSRAGMLATEIEREVRAQATASGRTVKFFAYGLGGQTYNAAATKPGTPTDRVIPWYLNRDMRWLDVAKAVKPTRVWLSFGMNDMANISANAVRNVVNEIKSWRHVDANGEIYGTDVVVLTNLVPRPYVGPNLPSNGPWNTQAPQEGADQAAGFIRSYAKWAGIGLLDMNRAARRGYGGFDPTQLVPVRVRDATPTASGAIGTRQVYGADCYFTINPAAFPSNGTGQIVIKLGPGDADLLIFTKTAVTDQYQIVVLSGNGGDQIGVAGPVLVTIPPPTDQAFELVCGVLDGFVYLHVSGLTLSGGFGEYSQNIWSDNVVKRGGLFTPSVTCNTAGVLSNISFSYMEPVAVRPTIDPTKLFSPGSNLPGTTAYGGSGYNHPAAWVGAYIYGPVLRGTRLYGADPLRHPFPRDIVITDDIGANRAFRLNREGFTAVNGFLCSSGGVRLSVTNAAPRLYNEGGGIGMAAGGATDAAYYRADTGGFHLAFNGGHAGDQYRFSTANPYPRIQASGGGLLLTAGGATATGFTTFGSTGDLTLSNGKVSALGALFSGAAVVGSYTVGTVPAGTVGGLIFVSNARKVSEAAGAGTGVIAAYSANAWRRLSDDTPIAA